MKKIFIRSQQENPDIYDGDERKLLSINSSKLRPKGRSRLLIIFLVSIHFSIFLSGLLLADIKDFDDIDRSFKDLERSMKQNSLKDIQRQQKYQLPQQRNQPFTQDIAPLSTRSIQPPQQDLLRPATDRAMLRNQERFKKLMDERKRRLSDTVGDWRMRIPEKYRFIVELFVITILITLFGLLFYKRRVKKEEEEKVPDEDKGSDDGITFYDVK